MRGRGTLIILACALAASFVSLVSGDNFSTLEALRASLGSQKKKNQELTVYTSELRREVHGLQTNDRILEKAARNELGMARQDEIIFIFDKK